MANAHADSGGHLSNAMWRASREKLPTWGRVKVLFLGRTRVVAFRVHGRVWWRRRWGWSRESYLTPTGLRGDCGLGRASHGRGVKACSEGDGRYAARETPGRRQRASGARTCGVGWHVASGGALQAHRGPVARAQVGNGPAELGGLPPAGPREWWNTAAGALGARYLIYMARPERFELPTLRFEA
jgi:hypothetical protein